MPPSNVVGNRVTEATATGFTGKARDISQERFALDGGFDRTYISLMERGISSPTLRALFKLAQMLQVAPSEIVKRTEDLLAEERKPATKRAPSRFRY